MLRRSRPDGDLFIGQPAHAWLSGQIARSWGNETFGSFEPRDEVCLAAAQHDIGMTEFDLDPTFNPETGLPHTFMEMDRPVHVEVWANAPRRLLPQSRYAALLVSMHGTGLYEYVDTSREPQRVRDLVQDYLDDQRALQRELAVELRADPVYGALAEEASLARNKRLIQIWDLMSLRICMGFESEMVERVPGAGADLPLFMRADGDKIMVDPWPFRDDALRLTCEGRVLQGPFPDRQAMKTALDEARWVALSFRLHPRGAS